MRIKSTTILISAVTALIMWKSYSVMSPKSPSTAGALPESSTATRSVAMKWSYDEMAHKLIIENHDLAYEGTGQNFSQGIGKALSRVTRQINGKPAILNL